MSRLTIHTPTDFDLAVTVTSYGYGRLAPNHWDSKHARFTTILPNHEAKPDTLDIKQHGDRLVIQTHRQVNHHEQKQIRTNVRRIFRLDENFDPWFKLHQPAKRHRFGRLIRSASLFEDMIKTITSCNVAWRNTVTMNAKLCEHVGNGCFPSPRQLAAWDVEALKTTCRVGYRAQRMIRLARDVEDGTLDLQTFETTSSSSEQLLESLELIHGIGPYAAANILQHLGRYDHVPIDSECHRHFLETRFADHPRPESVSKLDAMIRKTYDAYAPYAFLAYWYELWRGQRVAAISGG